ncbi:MAG TPA: hypothetical protein VGX94_00220 [Terriglobia bacterium]|nr:hypothetical protein [Terriglobia bacterium]
MALDGKFVNRYIVEMAQPPWTGTPYEPLLMRLKLIRKGKALPINPTGQLRFANYVYGVVMDIGRRFRGESAEEIACRKVAGQKLGLRERPPPSRLPPSKPKSIGK